MTNDTALDRVGVRRMMFYFEKKLRQTVRQRSFEPTPEELLSLYEECAGEILNDIKDRKGIFDFKIERTEPTKSKAEILFREGLEPIIVNWELK